MALKNSIKKESVKQEIKQAGKKIHSLSFVLSSIVILFVIVLTLALVALAYFSQFASIKDAYYNQTTNINTLLEAHIASSITKEKETIFALTKNNLFPLSVNSENLSASEDFGLLKTYLKDYVEKQPRYDYLILFEMNGKMKYCTESSITYPSVVDSPFVNIFSWAKKGEITSSTILKTDSNDPKFLIAVPVYDKEEIVGVFGAVVNVNKTFRDMISKIKIGDSGYVYLVNEQGLVTVHPDNSKQFSFDISKFEWGKQLLKTEKNETVEYNYEGRKRLDVILKSYEHRYYCASTIFTDDISIKAFKEAGLMIGVGLAAALLGSLFIFLMMKRRLGPLAMCKDLINDVAHGVLTKEYSGKIKSDEVGDISTNVNFLTGKLNDVLHQFMISARQLASTSKDLTETTESFEDGAQTQAASSEEITATIEEISAGMDNIADGAGEQLAKIEDLAERMVLLTEKISGTSEIVKNSMQLTETIEEKAQSSEKSLHEMNESMLKITDSSQEMTNIIGIINDISEQINLLSLNAAIEAARAGDTGKGFAVVADEIAKLADQTAQSTNEINAIIQSNNTEIEKGRSSVAETINVMSMVIEGVEKINDQMEEITNYTQEQIRINKEVNEDTGTVRQRADEIKVATEEQKLGINEIVRSISNMNDLIQNNAAGSKEMSINIDKISEMSVKLADQVEYFKLKEKKLEENAENK